MKPFKVLNEKNYRNSISSSRVYEEKKIVFLARKVNIYIRKAPSFAPILKATQTCFFFTLNYSHSRFANWNFAEMKSLTMFELSYNEIIFIDLIHFKA